MLSIDHAVLAVADLDEAGERISRDHGLASIPGGVHPAWGTANRIIPLGSDYIELIAVVDPEVASRSVFGRDITAFTADGRDRWAEICVADTDVDATAARLGIKVGSGSRTTTDGREIRWHGAGLEEGVREPYLPFFIRWDVPEDLMPGRMHAQHRVEVRGIERIEVSGEAGRLREWLGGQELPIDVVTDGEPAIRSVVLSLADGGTLELRP
jgi:hypothetical protein